MSTESDTPTEHAPSPLRDGWSRLVVLTLVGAVVGGVGAKLRSPAHEAVATLEVARVPVNPLDPAHPELAPVEPPAAVASWLAAPGTLAEAVGDRAPACRGWAHLEASGLVALGVVAPDAETAVDAVVALGRLAEERHAKDVSTVVAALNGVVAKLEGTSPEIERSRVAATAALGATREATTRLLAPPTVTPVPGRWRPLAILGGFLGFLLGFAWTRLRAPQPRSSP